MGIAYAFLAIAALLGFILLVVVAGQALRDPKRKLAWSQLSTMIGGIYSSKVGALYYRHKISGNYKGIPVEVFIEQQSGGDDPDVYTYHLRIKTGGRGHDWRLRFSNRKIPGSDRNWYLESRVESLKRRLTEALAVELVEGDSQVQYRADAGTLEYEKIVDGDTSVPTLDEFEDQFNLLRYLAELNEEVQA